MFRLTIREALLRVSTRTSRQTFGDKRVVPDVVLWRLRERWHLGPRRVFVHAYKNHYGPTALQSKESRKRIAQDYLQYCRSWHRWLPYYVLREDQLAAEL